MTANQIAYQRLREEGRANLARESETKRANLSNESIKRQELGETSRHNIVSEQETQRSNVAREAETTRSNLAKELEATRHNVRDEFNRQEANRITEQLGYSQLSEATRHNLSGEAIQRENIQSQENIASNRNTNAMAVATLQGADKMREAKYREEQANLRQKAALRVEEYKADVSTLGGIVSSFSRLIPAALRRIGQ